MPVAQAAALTANQAAVVLTTQIVDPNPGRGVHNAIALDLDNAPHIAYYDSINADLLLATRPGETWFREEVDSEGDTGLMPSIAQDSQGRTHLAYFDQTNGDLRYARQVDPDGWNRVTVDSDGNTGWLPSLALDRDDQPHIAYWNQSLHALQYAHFDGTQWQIQTVAADVFTSGSITLALTSEGLARIIYQRSAGPQSFMGLGYAAYDGVSWSVETIAADPAAGSWSSLALDASDNPHIAYSVSSAGLRYITYASAWSAPEAVDTGALAGSNLRLALDPAGRPRIVFFDGAVNGVRLAYRDGTLWRKETLLGGSSNPYIIMDSTGTTHISLINTTTNILNYIAIQPFADLIVSDIWLEGSTIHFQTYNLGPGEAPAGLTAALLINGSKSANYTFAASIPAGGRVKASFAYALGCPVGEQRSVRVDINPGGTITEISRANNSLEELWTCRSEPPAILTGPSVSGITQTSATIQWSTNVAADSQVNFGRRPGNYATSENPAQVTNHSVTLTGLTPGVPYAYEVNSTNTAGQSVHSKTLFFETLPAGGNVPTGITRTITRDPDQSDVYTLTANIPNASGAERVDFYVQLYPGGPKKLIGSAYGGASVDDGGAMQFQTKFSPGKAGYSRQDLASASIITQVSVLGGSTENFEDLLGTLQPLQPEVQITAPTPDYTLYIEGDVVPASTYLPVSVYASGFEWGCEWSGGGLAPDCDDVARVVDEIKFLIMPGNILLINPTTLDYNMSSFMNISGLATGDYTLYATAKSNGEVTSISIPFHITRGEAQATIERAVYRTGNAFNVSLTIRNAATASLPLEIDSLIDNIRGFQPVFDDAGDTRLRSLYSPSTRSNRVIIDIDQGANETRVLNPGESYQLSYLAIPILYENNMLYEMGNVELGYLTGGQHQLLFSQLPAHTAVDPSSVTPIPLAASVANALKQDDYLLITHPANLKSSFGTTTGEPNWNTLLRRMADLAHMRQGALAFMDSPDADVLNNLLEPDDPTWTAKLHPNFIEYAGGYVLIVGEPGVMPSNSVDGLVYSTTENERVDLTDNPFAHTGGDGAPDLMLGRIPGTTVAQLIKPIETSLAVLRGTLSNDRSHALGSWGTGDGISVFKETAETHKQRLLDHGWTVNLLSEEEEVFISGPLDIPFDEGDLVAAGDLNNDGREELIIGDISTDEIYRVEFTTQGYSRTLWFEYSYDLRAYSGFEIGNVDDDPQEELVIATYNDRITATDGVTGVNQPPIDHNFAYTDKLLLANMDSDEQMEILVVQGGDMDILNADGSLVRSFELDAGVWDYVVAGDILQSDWVDEIVHFDYETQRAFIYSRLGTLLDEFPANFNQEDSIIVADVDNRTPDDTPAEIWALDWKSNGIRVYQSYGEEPKAAWLPQRVDENEKLVMIQLPGETLPAVWLLRRTDKAYQIDRNYARGMQTKYAMLADGMDYLFYRGHGSSNGWESIAVNTAVPLDFGITAPIAVGLTCLSGDYGGSGSVFSEKMLAWGAGVFFGSTEVSSRENNSEASGWIANHARDNEPFALTMLRYKNNKWGGKPLAGSSWAYWVHEYNIYGDPKFGYNGDTTAVDFVPDTSSGAVAFGAAITAAGEAGTESSNLHVDIPAYQVAQADGYDWVDIPDGEIRTIDGQPRIPFYTIVQEYPSGTRVSDVRLTARGGKTTTTGLNLPTYTTQIDSAPEAPTPPRPKSLITGSEYAWTPDPAQIFTWDVAEHADGSSTLYMHITPFYYSPATTDVEFYSSYDFSVSTVNTDWRITRLAIHRSVVAAGEDVVLNASIVNNSGLSADILVNAVLRNAAGAEIAAAELHTLEALTSGATATYSAVIPTAGLLPGSYEVVLELRTSSGVIIDIETAELTLGHAAAQLTGLTAQPSFFQAGQTLQIQLTVTSAGDLPLTGAVAHARAFDPNGALVVLFEEALEDLPPGQSTLVSLPWDTTGLESDTYTVQAYVQYASTATAIQQITVSTLSAEIYLPLIVK